MGGVLLSETPKAVRAEESLSQTRGLQLRLPPTWVTYRQSGTGPAFDTRPREVMYVGNPSTGVEMKIMKVPLLTSERDPQGLGGLALIDYFYTPEAVTPRVTDEQVIEILSKGIQVFPLTFSFNLTGNQNEFRDGLRFLRFDYDWARCEGVQIQGMKSKLCQSPNGAELPLDLQHHAQLSTVIAGPSVKDQGSIQYLWTLDFAAPLKSWPNVSAEVNEIMASCRLEVARNGTKAS